MNRREFLELLGIGAAVVATPKVFGWTRGLESGLYVAPPSDALFGFRREEQDLIIDMYRFEIPWSAESQKLLDRYNAKYVFHRDMLFPETA